VLVLAEKNAVSDYTDIQAQILADRVALKRMVNKGKGALQGLAKPIALDKDKARTKKTRAPKSAAKSAPEENEME